MDFHALALRHLCRVCQDFVQPETDTYNAILYAKELQSIWQINVWTDESGVHPQQICKKCHRKVLHVRNGTRSYTKNPDFQIFNFVRHSRTGECETCLRYKSLKGGCLHRGHTKIKPVSTTTGIQHPKPTNLPFSLESPNIFSFDLSELSSNYKLDISSSVPTEQHQFFICPICTCILANPVQGECQHTYCSECLTNFSSTKKVPQYPVLFVMLLSHSNLSNWPPKFC